MDSERAEYEMEVLPLRSVTALRRHLSRRLSCEQDVNDIAQEACLRLLQAHRNKANIQNPNAYLYRIAGNLLYHHYAGQAKRDVANTVDNLADDSSCPEEQTTRAMHAEQINRTVRELSPKCQQALYLRWRKGMQVLEIAEAMNLSRGMVKKYLAQGLAHCRGRLTVEGAEEKTMAA